MKSQSLKYLTIGFVSALVLLSVSTVYARFTLPPFAALAKDTFKYKVGDPGPGRGWIFFVDYHDQYPGFTYLEAAPEDASPIRTWCPPNNSNLIGLDGWDDKAVGRGRDNTDTMLDSTNAVGGCTGGAAVEANEYSTDTTYPGEWFLPSLGEVMLMYTNLLQAGVGDFRTERYWSSSEASSASAWSLDFSTGDQFDNFKNHKRRVRAVRAF